MNLFNLMKKNVYFIRMETTGLFELMFDHNQFKYKYMTMVKNLLLGDILKMMFSYEISTCSYEKTLVTRAESQKVEFYPITTMIPFVNHHEIIYRVLKLQNV